MEFFAWIKHQPTRQRGEGGRRQPVPGRRPGMGPAYATSKGWETLTRAWAAEFGPPG